MDNHIPMMRRFLVLLLLISLPAVLAASGLDRLRADAERGDPWAQLNLGAAYDNGTGIPSDPAQAILWYRRAADQGLAQAQFNLGHSYAMGNGVNQDYPEAVRWLTLAARQGMAEAQFLLGVCHLEGLGVAADRSEAKRWLGRAVKQHHQPAIDYARRHHLSMSDKP